jgi:hypothetical protein
MDRKFNTIEIIKLEMIHHSFKLIIIAILVSSPASVNIKELI